MPINHLKIIALLAMLSFLPAAYANSNINAVHELAQGCYAVQSPKNGQFMQRYRRRGLIDDGMRYRFRRVNANQATRFFLKPTGLGTYMLRDNDGYLLSGRLSLMVTARKPVSRLSDWEVSATSDGRGGHLFTLKSKALNMPLRHNYRRGKVYFFDMWNMRNRRSESKFRLVRQANCRAFPEIGVDAAVNVDALKGNPNDYVRGYIEAHAHITSNEFLGGKMLHGKPFHPYGVTEALNDSRVIHGPRGSLDIIGNLLAYNGLGHRYNTQGWPNFEFWPNYKQMSHTGYYYKWMERAYLSGLRLLVTHLVENKTLCRAQGILNPAGWVGANDCDTMESIRLQAKKLKELEAYIDAQAGGPGKGFFRIVTSPTQARQIIADGKMAVLMGVEASETFSCGIGDRCTRESINRQLDELYGLGIRSIFPTHKFDNQFGGSQVREGNGFINLGHFLNAGYFWKVKECDAETKGKKFTSGFPLFPDAPLISRLLGLINRDLNPQYDETIESCNQNGLTELGAFLVNRLMDKNMLIELDHTSVDSSRAILNIAEARNYSGLVSSHGWMARAKDGGLHSTSRRLLQLGGIITPYNANAKDLEGRVDKILDEIEQTPFIPGVGISTDMGGLGGQASPRNDSSSTPLTYPFTSEFGFVFNKQRSGNRVYDLNADGVAHYGLLADHIQDIREYSSPRTYEAVMNSAEAYLQMWERAEANRTEFHAQP